MFRRDTPPEGLPAAPGQELMQIFSMPFYFQISTKGRNPVDSPGLSHPLTSMTHPIGRVNVSGVGMPFLVHIKMLSGQGMRGQSVHELSSKSGVVKRLALSADD
jgi:hypothetical protein